jgi:hypothetical protein
MSQGRYAYTKKSSREIVRYGKDEWEGIDPFMSLRGAMVYVYIQVSLLISNLQLAPSNWSYSDAFVKYNLVKATAAPACSRNLIGDTL